MADSQLVKARHPALQVHPGKASAAGAGRSHPDDACFLDPCEVFESNEETSGARLRNKREE